MARPLLGGKIPKDLKRRLGATHYDGRYYFSDKPYLLEGCEALENLGFGAAKLWFGRNLRGYDYNSDWKLRPDTRLVEVAQHPYFRKAFGMKFSTFALEIFPVGRGGVKFTDPAYDYGGEEKEIYELAAYLLKTYSRRHVTFLLQNWEGDWMLRGLAGKKWEKGGPPDAEERCQGFIRWLEARQRGIARARAEVSRSKCKVYHAAEVNTVWASTEGIPTLVSHVLPHVAVDLVSWSSYDGMKSAVKAWQGIELIRGNMRPSPVFGKPVVYIGEIGNPEQGQTEAQIVEWWDRAMGVLLAQNVPWIFHWELYCNEPKDRNKRVRDVLTADKLRGFWLIRPDGSLSWSGRYLTSLLHNAGRRLPRAAGDTLRDTHV